MTHRLYTSLEIDARTAVVWNLLIDTSTWPRWGPTVRAVDYPARFLSAQGSGTVTTLGGLRLPFRVTEFEPGTRWAWQVAGVPATDHIVTPNGPSRCRLAFGAPAIAWPYLAVCRRALRNIEREARQSR